MDEILVVGEDVVLRNSVAKLLEANKYGALINRGERTIYESTPEAAISKIELAKKKGTPYKLIILIPDANSLTSVIHKSDENAKLFAITGSRFGSLKVIDYGADAALQMLYIESEPDYLERL